MSIRKLFFRFFAVLAVVLAVQWYFTGNASAQRYQPNNLWNGRARLSVDSRFFGESFGMHFISTWLEGNTLYTYYIGSNKRRDRDGYEDERRATGLALTTDGVNFVDQGTVINVGSDGTWDDIMASFPGVWKLTRNRWAVVYEGAGQSPGDIGLALSPDGRNFTKDANPILRHAIRQANDPQVDLQWERNNIGTPSLYVVNGTRYLFYHGFGRSWERGSPDDCQVGVAIGTDLRNMRRYEGNPILTTGPSGSWDSGTIGKRDIIRGSDGWYYMVYEGSTDQPYDKAQWSVGLARSRNLLNWEKFASNPILPQTPSSFGYDGPEWVRTPDGGLHIYFRHPNGQTSRATFVRR
ncbi:hypothetical protein H6G00_21860 [Leptolyngbya sp. FACHB-541]|uniref:hypothetical protein n=1 Tax=Leptolyngbya sp. FACHB-541 TaxID=2692810 RepID=UPI001682533E|nr:hypothetical protein [Leptolyngbya sp. FACHB-541]MBD1999227.1 hypothetical protein [Leptolyngbya sp. FACHB-541]